MNVEVGPIICYAVVLYFLGKLSATTAQGCGRLRSLYNCYNLTDTGYRMVINILMIEYQTLLTQFTELLIYPVGFCCF